MKAKVLQDIEIFHGEVLKAGSEVEIVYDVYDKYDIQHLCELPDFRRVNIDSENLEITDWRHYINWEQRRYEIAKEVLSTLAQYPEDFRGYGAPMVKESIGMADELIKQLKGE